MSATILTSGALASGTSERRLGVITARRAALAIILAYWVVYENVVFFYPAEFGGTGLVVLTNLVKLGLPMCLVLITGLPSPATLTRGRPAFYVLFFALLLAWSVVPTAVSGDLVGWLKLIPRFAFFLGVLAFFGRYPSAFTTFAKGVVIYVLSALVQYVLVYATGAYGHTISTANGLMAGPFGLLGNVTSMMNFPGMPLPFVRLTGFWNEPSNASGSAWAAVFLSRYLFKIGEGRFWRHASIACAIAGVLTFSNAGYLAVGCALLAALVLGGQGLTLRRLIHITIGLPLAAAVIITVLLGRRYVDENLPNNVWARAFTGARIAEVGEEYDPTNGRLRLLHNAAATVSETTIGLGIQEVGTGGIESSASAPIYWLLLTGFPGLVLLLLRESMLVGAARRIARPVPASVPISQALVAVMAQQSVYGSWMNPNYFVLAAMVLVCASGTLLPALSRNDEDRGLTDAAAVTG